MRDWYQGVIGDLARGVRGVSYRPEHLLPSFAPGAAVLLRATNIQAGKITFEDVQLVPTSIVSDDQRVHQHDIIVCMSNGSKSLVGKSAPCKAQSRDPLTVGAFCSVFHPRPTANPSFVAHLFNGHGFRRSIDITLAGSAINNLRNSHLESFPCRIPKPDEQLRIAAVLDTVDEAIAKTEALIAKLRRVRAGLLHDLLTRGLDHNGQLRDPIAHPEQFKDSPLGRIPRDWDVKPCQSLCREIVVGIVVKPTQYYVEDGVPVLRSANVREGGIQLSDLVFISPESNALLSKSMLHTGDVVTVRTGYPGTTCVVPAHLDGANCVDLIISRPGGEILPAFLALWVNSSFGKDQVLRVQGGLAQQHFNVGEMKTLLVAKPKLDEQNAIIQRLATLDSHTAATTAEGVKLSALKSGLMNDLLTGGVRVPQNI